MNEKANFTYVVGCVVFVFRIECKPLTTKGFLRERFVITPPHRDKWK